MARRQQVQPRRLQNVPPRRLQVWPRGEGTMRVRQCLEICRPDVRKCEPVGDGQMVLLPSANVSALITMPHLMRRAGVLITPVP
jgi:hypothetical protein